jgi:hypothetical protein
LRLLYKRLEAKLYSATGLVVYVDVLFPGSSPPLHTTSYYFLLLLDLQAKGVIKNGK